MSTLPFLKWVGGKRWLSARYSWLIPNKIERYVEPFLGGGAMLFYLEPKTAVIADVNTELISAYSAIKKDWERIYSLLGQHQKKHSEDYYYRVRELECIDPFRRAARFLYLNRACFNGIYRVNRRGEFNVPKGSKAAIVLPDDDFQGVSRILKSCRIYAQDFEKTLTSAQAGDFIFVDPPYTVKHNNNGFIKYNQQLFSWDDQIRLCRSVELAASKGASVLVTNANHESIRALYRGLGEAHVLSRASIISAAGDRRGVSTELAITVGYTVVKSATRGRQNSCAIGPRGAVSVSKIS